VPPRVPAPATAGGPPACARAAHHRRRHLDAAPLHQPPHGVEHRLPGGVPRPVAEQTLRLLDREHVAADQVLPALLPVLGGQTSPEGVPGHRLQRRGPPEPGRGQLGVAADRQRVRRRHEEVLAGCRIPVRDRALERLRHVVGVHVGHRLRTDPGDAQRLPRRQRPPHRGVEIARRADRRPPGPADVAGVQRRGDQAAGGRLRREHPRDRVLLDAVLPQRRGRGALGHGEGAARAGPPDRPAEHQVPHLPAQPLDQPGRRLPGEAHQVDHGVRAQRDDPVRERPGAVLPLPVGDDPLDVLPLRRLDVRRGRAAADRDHLVAGPHEAGDEERADVAAPADDDDAHGAPSARTTLPTVGAGRRVRRTGPSGVPLRTAPGPGRPLPGVPPAG
jgi:hypothetical protein